LCTSDDPSTVEEICTSRSGYANDVYRKRAKKRSGLHSPERIAYRLPVNVNDISIIQEKHPDLEYWRTKNPGKRRKEQKVPGFLLFPPLSWIFSAP
jgi:hypothetical protein